VDIWYEIFLKNEYKEYSKNIYSYHLKILGVDEEYKEYSPSKKKKEYSKNIYSYHLLSSKKYYSGWTFGMRSSFLVL
jgi:hypothetical protein